MTAKSKSKSKKMTKVELEAQELQGKLAKKWIGLYSRSKSIETLPYNMKQTFQEKTAIAHKVLGWGYILSNENHRLEVLFKDGVKQLISNYKV